MLKVPHYKQLVEDWLDAGEPILIAKNLSVSVMQVRRNYAVQQHGKSTAKAWQNFLARRGLNNRVPIVAGAPDEIERGIQQERAHPCRSRGVLMVDEVRRWGLGLAEFIRHRAAQPVGSNALARIRRDAWRTIITA